MSVQVEIATLAPLVENEQEKQKRLQMENIFLKERISVCEDRAKLSIGNYPLSLSLSGTRNKIPSSTTVFLSHLMDYSIGFCWCLACSSGRREQGSDKEAEGSVCGSTKHVHHASRRSRVLVWWADDDDDGGFRFFTKGAHGGGPGPQLQLPHHWSSKQLAWSCQVLVID